MYPEIVTKGETDAEMLISDLASKLNTSREAIERYLDLLDKGKRIAMLPSRHG